MTVHYDTPREVGLKVIRVKFRFRHCMSSRGLLAFTSYSFLLHYEVIL